MIAFDIAESEIDAKICSKRNGVPVHRRNECCDKSTEV